VWDFRVFIPERLSILPFMNKPKIIVLTGATRGLGRALVSRFVSEGHTVIGCGRNAVHIDELRTLFGPPHLFTAIDVTDEQSVEDWATLVFAKIGIPDLLINNAALMNVAAPLWEIPAGDFDRVIDVNIKGPANVIRSFVPAMVERGSGVIVNFSSGWGRSTSPNVAPYCATKYAIEGMTLALAQELPDGMAAIPLNPGVIDTDMLRQAWADEASQFQTADQWAARASGFLLNLGPNDNGRSMSV
jgi:NAD(P)-dependent dehydrogenase (short-subunit alcohol dehydrogenase family)